MALTGKQTLLAIVITYLGLLVIFRFAPPTILTTTLEIVSLVMALSMLVISALMKRGKLKPGSWWGRSATVIFWQGIGLLILGLGNFSPYLKSSDLAYKLKWASVLIGSLIVIVASLAGRRRAKRATES